MPSQYFFSYWALILILMKFTTQENQNNNYIHFFETFGFLLRLMPKPERFRYGASVDKFSLIYYTGNVFVSNFRIHSISFSYKIVDRKIIMIKCNDSMVMTAAKFCQDYRMTTWFHAIFHRHFSNLGGRLSSNVMSQSLIPFI